ncbi:acyl-CoA dehydrogenase family protein [Lentzea sp. CA-135723]|uniref:acyl-CoA dehydrogenase family protein n=1 Tax=Lentzea sp. CA-135723 TaxID=3239950 RepID=UPI003D9339B5
MMFTLSPEQTDLAAVLHGFLGSGRTDLASLGVDEVTDPVDLVVVFEELGHHALPGPWIESLAVVPALLGRPAPKAGTWSVAFPPLVPHAAEADHYLLADGTTLHHASPTTELSSVDPARRLRELSPGPVIATGVPTEHAFNLGVLTCAAQLLGLGRAVLDMSTDHVKARHQFGKPIGQFQAVKHHLANVLIGLELARPLVHGAAVTLTTRDISAAKVAASDAAWQAARTALQVHGAIGYTAEHDLSRFLLRTRALRTAWGSPSMHRARVLEAL